MDSPLFILKIFGVNNLCTISFLPNASVVFCNTIKASLDILYCGSFSSSHQCKITSLSLIKTHKLSMYPLNLSPYIPCFNQIILVTPKFLHINREISSLDNSRFWDLKYSSVTIHVPFPSTG